MEHLSSLKTLRAILAGATLLVLTGSAEATLNILGMPMNLQVGQDVMDFNMGASSHSYSKSVYEEEDCDEDEDATGNKMGVVDEPSCLEVKPSAWTLSNMYRDQPLFMNFRPRTEEAMLIDNMCFTFFPLPDDQFTYVMYTSTVYRDGSNLVESDIVTDVQLGIFRAASPYCTYKDHVLGYAGCDTFVMYRCYMSNDCRNRNSLYTYGLSQSCKQISISCLQKIEDIIQGNGIPEQDYVALPMKMPTQCVFDPVCTFQEDVEVVSVGLSQGELINPAREVIFVEEDIFSEPEPFFTLATRYNVERFIPDTPRFLGPSRRQADFLSFNNNNYFKR